MTIDVTIQYVKSACHASHANFGYAPNFILIHTRNRPRVSQQMFDLGRLLAFRGEISPLTHNSYAGLRMFFDEGIFAEVDTCLVGHSSEFPIPPYYRGENEHIYFHGGRCEHVKWVFIDFTLALSAVKTDAIFPVVE